MSCCDINDCGYLDIIGFQHRARHYENGAIQGTWFHHQLPPTGITTPFVGGLVGKPTNFVEFSRHGQYDLFDAAGNDYWRTVCWVVGQHPIGFMGEMLEDLNIELTEEEAKYIQECDLLLYYVTEHVWDHALVPGERPTPALTCVLTDAATGRLVRTLWAQPLYPGGYEWNKAASPATECDNFILNNRDCVWRASDREDNQILDYPKVPGHVNYQRGYVFQSMRPTKERVVLLGPPAGKCDFSGPGGTLNTDAPLAFGHIVQIRSTYTGELLFDGAVESEVAVEHFTFEGSEITCGSDNPWCEPPEPGTVGDPTTELGWVPTGLQWAYAFGDQNVLGCSTVFGNRTDLHQTDEDDNEYSLWPTLGSIRLVFFEPSPDNPFMLREQNRSPLGFVPYTGMPTFSPDGQLWVSAYKYTYGVPRDDPEFAIEYGVWKVSPSTIAEPFKEVRLADCVGTLSVWCDKLYCLENGGSRYDPETDTVSPDFFSKRAGFYSGLPEALSTHFVIALGYWGWEWGFWDDVYFDTVDKFWDFGGWGYQGWSYSNTAGCAVPGAVCTNYNASPVTWTSYVVADMTPGGDGDQIYFDDDKHLVNPCRDMCHDQDLTDDDGLDCTSCNCSEVDIEVDLNVDVEWEFYTDDEPPVPIVGCCANRFVHVTCDGYTLAGSSICGDLMKAPDGTLKFWWGEIEGEWDPIEDPLTPDCPDPPYSFPANEAACGDTFTIKNKTQFVLIGFKTVCGCEKVYCISTPAPCTIGIGNANAIANHPDVQDDWEALDLACNVALGTGGACEFAPESYCGGETSAYLIGVAFTAGSCPPDGVELVMESLAWHSTGRASGGICEDVTPDPVKIVDPADPHHVAWYICSWRLCGGEYDFETETCDDFDWELSLVATVGLYVDGVKCCEKTFTFVWCTDP